VLLRQVDVLPHDLGIGFILASKQRDARHIMSGKTRRRPAYRVPFPIFFRPEMLHAGFVMV
jgi:hypothetical protein